MRKKTLYSLRSPYRESMDVIGFQFGHGEKAACVVGAMRGNEVQQMYVCSRLVNRLKALEAEGLISKGNEIMIIPSANYYSMNIGKRFWTMDNTDINRMFPGYDLGETTQRIAAGIFESVKGYRYGVQLASFYQQGDFLPHVKLMETGFTDHEPMRDFGLPYAFIRKPRPYDTTTLNYNWQIWETQAFSVYTNATDNIDEPSAKLAVDAILRFMALRGVIRAKVPGGYITELLEESSLVQIHSTAAGIYKSFVQTGDEFRRGDILCEITDPLDGSVIRRIAAPCDGIVFFRYNRPLEFENTVLYKIIPI
ncbi:MAG: M14 family metallopeptidase [Lachnospiraceae bacterium]|nr:M14 family metallopeptidase [Ruminococcus sp.]MCM1275912.1 M14 family metallopeptidase [Lachnospiraceae bacterium]